MQVFNNPKIFIHKNSFEMKLSKIAFNIKEYQIASIEQHL
jgi:hypothetical protein